MGPRGWLRANPKLSRWDLDIQDDLNVPAINPDLAQAASCMLLKALDET